MTLPKDLIQPHRTITTKELFPTAEGKPPTPLQIQVLILSQEIGVPFPVEPNPKYANWWHSLHEVAHWAVKPRWYNKSNAGTETIPVATATLTTTAGPQEIDFYQGGNDIIPNMGMYTDPTPAEDEVRPWTILTMHAMKWEHPFRTILRERQSPEEMRKRGDDGWHKIATAHVWSPVTPAEPTRVAQLAKFGINPLIGNFRPNEDGFSLPNQNPTALDELNENFRTVLDRYQTPTQVIDVPEATELGQRYWNTYRKWAKEVNENTPPEVYNKLLQEFDRVATRSIELFQETYNQYHQKNK